MATFAITLERSCRQSRRQTHTREDESSNCRCPIRRSFISDSRLSSTVCSCEGGTTTRDLEWRKENFLLFYPISRLLHGLHRRRKSSPTLSLCQFPLPSFVPLSALLPRSIAILGSSRCSISCCLKTQDTKGLPRRFRCTPRCSRNEHTYPTSNCLQSREGNIGCPLLRQPPTHKKGRRTVDFLPRLFASSPFSARRKKNTLRICPTPGLCRHSVVLTSVEANECHNN